MQKFFYLFISLTGLLNLGLTQNTVPTIKKLPKFQSNRIQHIDIHHIGLDLRFDWQKKQAYGTAAIKFSTLHTDDKIKLDAGMLTIYSVRLSDGKELCFNYDGGDKEDGLEISLDKTYPANKELNLVINYDTNWQNIPDPNTLGGSNGKGIRFFEPTSTEPRKRKQIWSMSSYQSNRYWFPCSEILTDLRTTELKATVDKNLMVISNGKLIETIIHEDGSKGFHWSMDKAYPNYQTCFVVGEYQDIQLSFGKIELHNYGYPDEAEAVKASVERLPDMFKFYTDKTGVAYPRSSYAQVFVQDLPWGMDGSTVSTHTENMIDDYGTHSDFLYLWDGLEAEGLAHQWFGSIVFCGSWNDIWLNKSFSHYMDGLYTEHKNGRDEYLLYYTPFDLNTLYLNDWNSGYRHPIVTSNYEDQEAFINDNYVNRRGALVLRMLQKQLGEKKWWPAFKQYVKTYANKTVTTRDFQKAIESSSGESLTWFFDQWIYKMGHPIFEVTKTYDSTKKLLHLNLKQVQTLDTLDEYPQTPFFKGKMDIEIDGRIISIEIEPRYENHYSFPVSQQPRLVHIDFENTWIKELRFEKSLDELLYQFQNDKDVLGRQWAMATLVKLAKDEKTTDVDKSLIQSAFTHVISSKVYWRLRFNALNQLNGLLTTPYDPDVITMLEKTINKDRSWVRTVALSFLGNTREAKYVPLYLQYLNDSSDRVVNAAAIALGKSKSPLAYDALIKLKDKPSWKNQSLISSLNGLKELADPRGTELAMKALIDADAGARWTLATPVWDFRLAAAITLVALNKSQEAYPVIFEKFNKSIQENDINDIFNNALLIATLADPRGQEAFDLLKERYKDDAHTLNAVTWYETQFKDNLK